MTRECVTPLLVDFFNTSCFGRWEWQWWQVHGVWSSRDPAALFRNNATAELAKRRQEQRESARRGACEWGCVRLDCEVRGGLCTRYGQRRITATGWVKRTEQMR